MEGHYMATETKPGHVWVTLRRTVQERLPGGTAGPMYGPGTVQVPEHFANSLGLEKVDAPAAEGDAAGAGTGTARTAADQGGQQQAPDRFEDMTRAQLEAEAATALEANPDFKVERADGKAGEPLVTDYQRALRAHEASRGTQPPTE